MSTRQTALLVGAGVLFLLAAKASAAGDPSGVESADGSSDSDMPYEPDETLPEVEMSSTDYDTNAQNLRAFLYMIRKAEHSAASEYNDVWYSTFYKGARFTNFADHPVLTGELTPIKLSDEICRRAGYGPGCVSTAAGAYQIRVPTWNELRSMNPRLPDFSAASQDEAAVRLLRQCGALAALENGNFSEAVRLASSKWASLPGNAYGQNPKSLDTVLAYFNQGLTIA